jgi:probable O-glycosylation ligase (exosortase A-associated)
MRDLALTLFLFGSLPFILKRPWYGALLWVWVSVMSPHRLTWSFAFDLQFAQFIALATLASLLISREPKRLPVTPVTMVLFMFVAWMNFTTLFALIPDGANPMWEKVMKSMLMLIVTMSVLHSKRHVQLLVAILTLSIAFFGVKGGWFTIRGGGVERVYGPAGSFIQENNSLALAVVMTIPLLRYLQTEMTNRWLRWGMVGAMILCGFGVLGSQSRGALLAVAAMLVTFWIKSRNKMMTALLIAVVVPAAIAFMPGKWDERMQTIENYEEDASAMGRINAWKMAINVANDRPLTGGGFEIYTGSVFARYAPNPTDVHAAHSIYFAVLGEHGYIGLGLFLLLWFLAYREASWIISRAKKLEGWQWAADMAAMIQVSWVGYAVGGAFLSLSYYDVPYYLIVAVVLTRLLIEQELKKTAAPFFRGSRATPPPRAAIPRPGGAPVARSGQGPISGISRSP